ncbi:MAG: hypothetical protein EOO16_00860 [Chitinophagaceae bacterium]|nr:MAG: hypothetical protein EOO16_00860 [Chitinophagaceae bacterium]
MKRLYTGFVLILLFTSCTKRDLSAPHTGPAVAAISQIAAPAAPVATPWERPAAWTRAVTTNGSIRYSSTSAITALEPSRTENGLVLTFAKGYNLETPALEKPVGMPFQLYALGARTEAPLQWASESRPGSATVSVTLPAADEKLFEHGRNAVEIRHIVLSAEASAATGKTAMDLRNLPYTELCALLGIAK